MPCCTAPQMCKLPRRQLRPTQGKRIEKRQGGGNMRIGVRLGPVSVSTSTRSRRSRQSSQPSWHAKGRATTPDGREVDFRCQHSHRSQDAAINCAATVRKQIERGQSLHLITHVRSTPASREAARRRAAEQEARRQAKAVQRAQAAQQRAEQREAGRQAKAAQRAQTAQQRAEQQEARRQADAAQQAQAAQYCAQQSESLVMQRQPVAEQYPQFGQRAQQIREHRRDEAAYPPANQSQPFHQREDERRNLSRHRYAEPSRQRSLGWPIIGLIVGAAATVLGMVLAGMAGNNTHSALATAAGAIITLSILAVLVCATVAVLRRRKGHRNERSALPTPAGQDPRAHYPAPPVTSLTVYAPGTYPVAAEQPPHASPPRPYGDGAPWPPNGDRAPWPR